MAGRVDIGVAATSDSSLLKSGHLRALAITSKERSAILPNVPSVAESLPGFDVTTWMGLAAPAKTPAPVLQKLSADIQDLLKSGEIRTRIEALGLEPQSSTGAQMRDRMVSDVAKWKALVRDRNLQLTQ